MMIENIKELIDDIVTEVAFRTDSGLVDFRKREYIYILSEVLTEMGLGGVKDELISALTEVDEEKPKSPDDDKYSHKAYGYYVRKGDEEKKDAQVYTKGDDGTYTPSSTEDYEKAAAEQGEKGASSPTSDKPKDGVVGGGATQQAQPEKGTALNPNTKGGMVWNQNLPDGDSAKVNVDSEKPKSEKEDDGFRPIDKEAPTEKKLEGVADNLKDRRTAEGEKLDIETTDGGSLIIGVEHGEETESTKKTIQQITSLPKDTKIMFVGEGGMSKDDEGNIEFSGEQDEIRNAIKGHFNTAEESSWDENANVYDDTSPVYDEVAKSLGGNKSKAKASIWSNMVGQGDDMSADDYLDNEGKEWLINQAKAGGSDKFDGEVDWNNLTDEQRDDLYQLNFRDDENYGETEISKGQESYNDFRQKELDRKIKEAEADGYTVIAPVGNSHVDMWRERNKGGSKKTEPESTDTKSKTEAIINPKVSVITKEAANKDIQSQLDKNKKIDDERERQIDKSKNCVNIRSRTRAVGNPLRYDGIDNTSPISKNRLKIELILVSM